MITNDEEIFIKSLVISKLVMKYFNLGCCWPSAFKAEVTSVILGVAITDSLPDWWPPCFG